MSAISRYITLLEARSASGLKVLTGALQYFKGRPDVAWHQTGDLSALAILRDGFRTGEELQKGERCGAVFFTKVLHTRVNYNRDYREGSRKAVYLPVLLGGLNIIDSETLGQQVELTDDSVQMVQQGIWTPEVAQRWEVSQMMEGGTFPPGIDGIVKVRANGEHGGMALTKEAANRGLTAAVAELTSRASI